MHDRNKQMSTGEIKRKLAGKKSNVIEFIIKTNLGGKAYTLK